MQPPLTGPRRDQRPRPADLDRQMAAALNPERQVRSGRRRSIRVVALLWTIVVLSVADLHLTLLFLSTGGMGEANPFARGVMAHNSPGLLVLWKATTVFLSLGILYVLRRRPLAEAAAWAGCVVLAAVTLRWSIYAESAPEMARYIAEHNYVDEHWVPAPGATMAEVPTR